MKRRYKEGDWVLVPLGGGRNALAVIARACRSRLFGYFFASGSGAPSQDALRSLAPRDAIAVMLFGGSAIEQARWPVVATSLAFDRTAWPFPDFSSRGAFGDTWTQVRYDPDTLQIVTRSATDAATAAALPDARFADAHEAEASLRAALSGEAARRAERVCEVRSPIDPARLELLASGGRVQFSTPLTARDVDLLAQFVERHPEADVRVHGLRRGFDAGALRPLRHLRALTLDVHRLQHANALAELRALQSLRLGSMQLAVDFLQALPALRHLELRGTRARLEPLYALEALEELVLENTAPADLRRLCRAPQLRALTLAHGAYDLAMLAALPGLRELHLLALDAASLDPLQALTQLERLTIRGLHAVRDLSPLAGLASLRELEIAQMPHLAVTDFAPLRACAALHAVEADVGSKRKSREIYRLLRAGNT